MAIIIKKKQPAPPVKALEPPVTGKKLVIKGRKSSEIEHEAPTRPETRVAPPIQPRQPHPLPITRENFNPTLVTSEQAKELLHACSTCGKEYLFPCDDDIKLSRVCAGAIWKEQMAKGEEPTMEEVHHRIVKFNGPLPMQPSNPIQSIARASAPKPKLKIKLK